MPLSTDLKIYGQYGAAAAFSSSGSAPSGDSFSQVYSAVRQASGKTNYEAYFQRAADAYDVPVDLLKAVAKAESNFTADAVSRCGAQGVMQLMPGTARAMGVKDPFDPAQNIMGGAKYLSQMLNTFDGDVAKAVAAYNAGPNAIKKYGGVMPSQQGYVSKVLGYAGGAASGTVEHSGTSYDVDVLESVADMSLSAGPLTQDDLAELIIQAYRTNGSYGQEYVRMLMQQLFLRNAEDREDWEEQPQNMIL